MKTIIHADGHVLVYNPGTTDMNRSWKDKSEELKALLKKDYRRYGNISALGVESVVKLFEAGERVRP